MFHIDIFQVLAGSLTGFLVRLTGVGAGALGAVLLTYLYPLRLTPPRLIATDIVHAIPLAVAAWCAQVRSGHCPSGGGIETRFRVVALSVDH